MKNKVTVRELAAAATPSVASVSRALSGAPKVSPELRERIVGLARELGYRGGKRRKMLGVVLPSLEISTLGSYILSLLDALRKEIYRRDYQTVFVSLEDIELLNESVIDGVISFDFLDRIGRAWANLKALPLVCLNDSSSNFDRIYSVSSNELQGQRLIVDYLFKRGHRKIGFIKYRNPFQKKRGGDPRENAFRAAMKEHLLDPAPYIHLYDTEPEFTTGLGSLLRKGITAVIAADGENHCAHVQGTLQLFGKRVPEDISIVSWETDHLSEFLIPRQTVLVQNFPLLAARSLDLIEALIRGEKHVENILVDFRLVERDSVRTIPGSSASSPAGI